MLTFSFIFRVTLPCYLHRFKKLNSPFCPCGQSGDAHQYVFLCSLTKYYHLKEPALNHRIEWFKNLFKNRECRWPTFTRTVFKQMVKSLDDGNTGRSAIHKCSKAAPHKNQSLYVKKFCLRTDGPFLHSVTASVYRIGDSRSLRRVGDPIHYATSCPLPLYAN
ncbi:hypothetical protein AVEN_66244-1 [Araneus ventricosus]|uniref:Uncharacterized protein n=1 Tax=Araneus ventricosus TaxID=182803 RepID=A0A4Y2IXT3_ARAVE|nr:hypothetical protein AVEN_66244-1 [Araneus ventricosus]